LIIAGLKFGIPNNHIRCHGFVKAQGMASRAVSVAPYLNGSKDRSPGTGSESGKKMGQQNKLGAAFPIIS
jgi:hypothetical protein